MRFAPLRGFRDYPPPDAGARSSLRERMRASARLAGFTELETPSVESLELYTVKSGQEIVNQLWKFQDKGGRDVALTPETTPSLARVFAERAKAEPLPVKWFTVAKLWRYEEPQAGRTREFLQVNLDILGVPGIEAEGEILSVAALLMDSIGAKGLYAFRINDRALAEAIGRHFGARDLPGYFRAVDAHLKVAPREFDAMLEAAGLPPAGRKELAELVAAAGAGVAAENVPSYFDRLAALGLPAPGPDGLARLRRLFAAAGDFGLEDRLLFDPGLVRGIAYYTSTVFEAFDRKGDLRALFGGGRYDSLVELFGGPPTPAVGLAIGDQTLELLLRANGRWPEGEPPLDTYVVAVTAEEVPLAVRYVQRLRRAGTSADCDLLGRSLSRQLKEAARRRARRAWIVGPQERARGVVVERDLTSGAQHERSLAEALPPE